MLWKWNSISEKWSIHKKNKLELFARSFWHFVNTINFASITIRRILGLSIVTTFPYGEDLLPSAEQILQWKCCVLRCAASLFWIDESNQNSEQRSSEYFYRYTIKNSDFITFRKCFEIEASPGLTNEKFTWKIFQILISFMFHCMNNSYSSQSNIVSSMK